MQTVELQEKPAVMLAGPEDTIFDAVRRIEPIIRAGSAEAEQNRRLSRPVIDAMAEAGLFRLLAPRAIGGHELDPITYSRITEQVSAIDSAAGWVLQAGNVGAWWAARLPRDGAQEIYSETPSALMAAAFHPPQHAIEVPGGYRVMGRGPLASNVHDAEWLFLTAFIMEDGRPRMSGNGPGGDWPYPSDPRSPDCRHMVFAGHARHGQL